MQGACGTSVQEKLLAIKAAVIHPLIRLLMIPHRSAIATNKAAVMPTFGNTPYSHGSILILQPLSLIQHNDELFSCHIYAHSRIFSAHYNTFAIILKCY
ncbi:hypothetical protein QQG55_37005 [Brugia pahangi]